MNILAEKNMLAAVVKVNAGCAGDFRPGDDLSQLQRPIDGLISRHSLSIVKNEENLIETSVS